MQIVVGLTPRPESKAALDVAIHESLLRGARLHISRTMGQNLSENPSKARGWADDIASSEKEGAELVERLAARGVEATFAIEPVATDAAETLLATTERLGADLLIIGIRRRSPVGKLVLGSVSQAVLLKAECAVLAVKAPEDH